jgi:hypothetical protein
MNHYKKCERPYFYCVAGILVVTAIAKLISLSSSDHIWAVEEPIFGLAYRPLFATLAGAELLLAGCIVFLLSLPLKHALIGAFAACGISYHAARAFAQIPEPCPCLGKLFAWSPWLDQHSGGIALGLLILMGLMSLYFTLTGRSNITAIATTGDSAPTNEPVK